MMIRLLFFRRKYATFFKRVDHDYVLSCGQLAKKVGVKDISVVSSASASKSATFIYSKIKWDMEQAIIGLNFSKTSFFRPFHLMKPPSHNETCLVKFRKTILASLSRMLPAKQRAINVNEVAKAMVVEYELRSKKNLIGVEYYSSDDMRSLIENK